MYTFRFKVNCKSILFSPVPALLTIGQYTKNSTSGDYLYNTRKQLFCFSTPSKFITSCLANKI